MFVPNIGSAEKRVRVTKKKTLRNKSFISALRTAVKKANESISENAENRWDLVNAAIKSLTKASLKE